MAKIKQTKNNKSEDNTEKVFTFNGLTQKDEIALKQQIETEYNFAWYFMKPRWDEWALRIKLYNNQRRDKEAVGDPLLFTIHQTVLASLYNDKLQVSFKPREIGDQEVAENLDNLAEYDQEAMQKDMIDYQWDWDALFFGCGLLMFMEFDREKKLPIPENIDPMTVLRDPRGKSINGDLRKRGRSRFFGREIRATKYDMELNENYHNLSQLQIDNVDLRSFIDEEERIKQQAQGYSNVSQFTTLTGSNADYKLLEWFTFFKGENYNKAKLVFVTLGNNRKLIVRFKVMDEDYIPVIERRIYPTGDFDGVSIPDLVEDKQRARSIVQNLSIKMVKAGLHPSYLFNSAQVKRDQLANFDVNKFVDVKGSLDTAVKEMPRAHVNNDVEFILNFLNSGAQNATATPDIKSGAVTEVKKTATELNLVNQGVDTRYSLSAKIFGWSERRFWQQWYYLYKKFFIEGIDEKMVRISGVLGAKWRPFTRENIIAHVDPDVEVVSKILSDAEKFNKLAQYRMFLQTIATDPNANLRAGEKELGRLMGLKKDEISEVLPPVIEELRADDENILIEKGQMVEVLPNDDHLIHIHEHNKLSDSAYKVAHINAHKRALILQKQNPSLFPNMQPSATNPNPGQPVADTTMQNVSKPIINSARPAGQ